MGCTLQQHNYRHVRTHCLSTDHTMLKCPSTGDRGKIVGPFEEGEIPTAQVSRFGVIPKANQPNRWRLILELSSPHGQSVNDGIKKEICSLRYPSIDDAVEKIVQSGPGLLLEKVDTEHAYQNNL